ncbi:MAG: peptide chain release factor aRF-1, partial [Nanoarchaeota archaeon]|nr:peptide chain release factor aRF-1 [Nanoarchaeota archaeon]
MSVSKKELEKVIKNLGIIRGRHTELVSFYIPSGANLDIAVTQLKNEQSTSMNIKSKTVRKNVTGAIDKIIHHLRMYKQQTPPNGIAVFSGNVSEKDGVSDIQLWAVEPEEPLRTKLYWCGQNFILDPLMEMVKEREVYGLIVLDKSEATIGVLKGKRIDVLKHLDSIVPGKTKKGGWSQARYARIREGILHDFLKKVGDIASAQFKDIKELLGVIIGGPGPIKEQFFEGNFLDYSIQNKILGVVDTSYTGEHALNEVLEKSEELIQEAAVIKERKLLERYFEELAKPNGLGIYGLEDVAKAIKNGSVDIVLLSESFNYKDVSYECECGNKEERVVKEEDMNFQECSKCKA